ncbi:hypothetical protein MUP77_10205 [Candidatus Bathyarchaeota archaeon]|nr:hypothetical protein [Candidatus Bathyarchaeota archaeon]
MMRSEIKDLVSVTYFVFTIIEMALCGLSSFRAVYIVPLALVSAVTGEGIRRGYRWSSILLWATCIVSFVFGSSVAYASLLLGSASTFFGVAMVAFTVGTVAIQVYVSLNWRRLMVVES